MGELSKNNKMCHLQFGEDQYYIQGKLNRAEWEIYTSKQEQSKNIYCDYR